MRYGNSDYFTTAKQDQAAAFEAEVARAALLETKRTETLNVKLAKAGRVVYVGHA